jgi:parallel beta-helix repeat protein
MIAIKIKKKLFLTVVFLVLALATIVFVRPVSSQTPLPTIFIRPDGTVYPSTAPIMQSENTYTFTDNVYAAIKIQKSNIMLDGAGYTLTGPYNGTAMDVWLIGQGPNQLPSDTLAQYVIGIDLASPNVEGVTVENLNVKNFSIGMYIWTKNNTITGNGVSNNIVGILLSGSNQTVTKNYIADNNRGLFFGFNNKGDIIPSDIVINHNDFENNIVQLNGCECKDYNTTEPPHSWDDGHQGNFWSDYNGTDINGDGVGDTRYVIDVLNQDRYPLMQSPVKLQVPATKIPIELIVLGISAFIVIVVVVLVSRIRKKV